MSDLVLKDINKIYPNGFHAVHNFNLEIKNGEFIVLVSVHSLNLYVPMNVQPLCFSIGVVVALNVTAPVNSRAELDILIM